MYLTYDEFKNMGGTLDETAFKIFNRRAEYLINAQGNGRTGDRIGKLTELPQAVKDCTFELINHLSDNAFDGSDMVLSLISCIILKLMEYQYYLWGRVYEPFKFKR